jgi:hypothetical protein
MCHVARAKIPEGGRCATAALLYQASVPRRCLLGDADAPQDPVREPAAHPRAAMGEPKHDEVEKPHDASGTGAFPGYTSLPRIGTTCAPPAVISDAS